MCIRDSLKLGIDRLQAIDFAGLNTVYQRIYLTLWGYQSGNIHPNVNKCDLMAALYLIIEHNSLSLYKYKVTRQLLL